MTSARLPSRRFFLLCAAMIGLWVTAAWLFAEHYYQSRAETLINEEAQLSQRRADDLADSIRSTLGHMVGISDVYAQSDRVRAALLRFGPDVQPSTLPFLRRQAEWTGEPLLQALSRHLELGQDSLGADIVYVLNAAGEAIASSNWKERSSLIGTQLGDRRYFVMARSGRHGSEYAVGRTTRVAGLYFSTPLLDHGRFLGAVVTKIETPNLSSLLKQLNAFVSDSNGVIIVARNKYIEMHVLPGSPLNRLSERERLQRYQRGSFPTLPIEPWQGGLFPGAVSLDNSPEPHLVAGQEIPEHGITVHVDDPVPGLMNLQGDQIGLATLLGMVGSLVILMAAGAMLYFRSIMRSKAELWEQANFDPLTRLPNRVLFRERLIEEIERAAHEEQTLALLLVDIDHFKDVNDSLGHDVGDQLLKEAARRIQACARRHDTVARLGGDEFTLVLPAIGTRENADRFAELVIRALAAPFPLGPGITHVSGSIGITVFPQDAVDIDSLMKNADQAMYVAKRLGRNRYSHFVPQLREAAEHRLRVTNDLRGALDAGQLKVHYQPIVELATGQVRKAEALLRWEHPQRGLLSAPEFVPLAEESRLIGRIGRWLRERAVVDCKRWNVWYPEGFQVSVNQSPLEFVEDGGTEGADSLLQLLDSHDLAGSHLVIEITEGLLLSQDPRVKDKLKRLRGAGLGVAIDDFGTGYSSLSYLLTFDIDCLKIDRSFVVDLEQGGGAAVLCETVISLAHKLGLKVVAEGVETEQQRRLLLDFGCDYAQGFLFAGPMSVADFDHWLERVAHAEQVS